MATPIAYVMKAMMGTPPYQDVTWISWGSPDTSGTKSGYSGLINIEVDYTILDDVIGQQAVPLQYEAIMGGDISGLSSAAVVIGIQGRPIVSTAPITGQSLAWSGTAWTPTSGLPPGGTASGDLSGNFPAPSVIKINGTSVPATPSANQVLVATSGTASIWQQISNAQISSSAALDYSKLNLANKIVNSDINSAAAIDYSKLNLTGDIVNSDINGAAAIAYGKLNLTGNIINSDIANTAAIAGTKISPNFGNQNVTTTGLITTGSLRDTGLSTGIAHVDSSGNFTSSAVDLASSDVTGLLPITHLAQWPYAQALFGNQTPINNGDKLPLQSGAINYSSGMTIDNVTNNNITVGSTGVYFIIASPIIAYSGALPTTIYLQVFINGSGLTSALFAFSFDNADTTNTCIVPTLIPLNVNDVIDIRVNSGGGSTFGVSSGTLIVKKV